VRWSIVIGGLVALAAAAAVVVFAVKPSAVGATPSARDREVGKELFPPPASQRSRLT
jgi:hypothetical protein